MSNGEPLTGYEGLYEWQTGDGKQPTKKDSYLEGIAETIDDPNAPPPAKPDDYLEGLATNVPQELSFTEGTSRALQRGGLGLKGATKGAAAAGLSALQTGPRALAAMQGVDLAPPLGKRLSPQAIEAYQSDPSLASLRSSQVDAQIGAVTDLDAAAAPELSKSEVAQGWNPTALKWWTENGAELVPQLTAQVAAGLLSGGGSTALRAVASGAAAGIPAAGGAYSDAISRGKSETVALTEAAAIGVSNTALESLLGAELLMQSPVAKKVFGKVMSTRIGDLAATGVTGAGVESVTELAQTVNEDFIKAMAEQDPAAFKNWQVRYPTAAALGFVAGGAISGAGRLAEAGLGGRPLGVPQEAPAAPQASPQPQAAAATPQTAPKSPQKPPKPQTPPQTPPAGSQATPPAPEAPQAPAMDEDAMATALWDKAPDLAEQLSGLVMEDGRVPRRRWREIRGKAVRLGIDMPEFENDNSIQASTFAVRVMNSRPSTTVQGQGDIKPPQVETPPADQSPDAGNMVDTQQPVPAEAPTHTIYVREKNADATVKSMQTKYPEGKSPTFEVDKTGARPLARIRGWAGSDFGRKQVDEFSYSDTQQEGMIPLAVWTDENGNIKSVMKNPAPASTAPATPAAPVIAEQPTAVEPVTKQPMPFKLPSDLVGAKPRYSYGEKQFDLKFDSDLDRSLYIIAQPKPSKRDADYLKAVMDSTGMSEQDAREAGQSIRNSIKQQAKVADAGELNIPASSYNQPRQPIATTETGGNTTPATPEVPATSDAPAQDQSVSGELNNGQEDIEQGQQGTQDDQEQRQGNGRQEDGQGLLADNGPPSRQSATDTQSPAVGSESDSLATVVSTLVAVDPRVNEFAGSLSRQAYIPGMEAYAVQADLRERVWAKYSPDLEPFINGDALAVDRSFVLDEIPRLAKREIDYMLDDDIEEGDFFDAIHDRATDTSLDLPDLYSSDFKPDELTNKPLSINREFQVREDRAITMMRAFEDSIKAEYVRQKERIAAVYKKRRDLHEKENADELVIDVVYKMPSEFNGPLDADGMAKRDEWFNNRAVEMKLDPANLQDAWGRYKQQYDELDQKIADTQTDAEATEPPPHNPDYRDWRWKSRAKNSGTIYPNRPGAKFTDTQMGQITTWAKAHGWMTPLVSPTKIEVVDPSTNQLDLSMRGAEGVKQETAAVKAAESKAKAVEQEAISEAMADARVSAGWIRENLGVEMGAFNRNALSNFLEGTTAKFNGLVSQKWYDALNRLDALAAGMEQGVDWMALRNAYEQSNLSGEVRAVEPPIKTNATPIDPPTIPDVKIERASKSGDDLKAAQKQREERTAELRPKQIALEQKRRSLENKKAGFRSNAYKKRAEVDQELRAVDNQLTPIINEMRRMSDESDLEYIENALEQATDPVVRAWHAHERARKLQKLLDKDNRGNVIDSTNWKNLEKESDTYLDSIYKLAASKIDPEAASEDERNFAAQSAVQSWGGDPKKSLDDVIAKYVDEIYVSRAGRTRGRVEQLQSLAEGRKQELMDQIAVESRYVDWQDRHNKIIEEARKEDDANRKQLAEMKAIKDKADAVARAYEQSVEIREKRKQAAATGIVARYFDELGKRASKEQKGEDGKAFRATSEIDPKTGNRIPGPMVDAEVIGKWAIAELPDETGKQRKGRDDKTSFYLLHRETGLSWTSADSASALKKLMQLAQDCGVDMQGVSSKGEFNKPPKFMGEVTRIWETEVALPETEQMQAIADRVKIAETATKADIVLNSFELGDHGGKGLTNKGADSIRALAKDVPEFTENPVFTVEKNPEGDLLVFQTKSATFKFLPANFNLGTLDTQEYNTVGINIEDLNITPSKADDVIGEALKSAGFRSVSVTKAGVTASWKDEKVKITGTGNQWTASEAKGGKKAQAQANAVLKNLGKLKGETSAVAGSDPDYKGKDAGYGPFYFKEQFDEYNQRLSDVDDIMSSGPSDLAKASKLLATIKDSGAVGNALATHAAKTDPDLIRWMATDEGKDAMKIFDGVGRYGAWLEVQRVAKDLDPRVDEGLLPYPQSVFDKEWPKIEAEYKKSSPEMAMPYAAEMIGSQSLGSVQIAMLERLHDLDPVKFAKMKTDYKIPTNLLWKWHGVLDNAPSDTNDMPNEAAEVHSEPTVDDVLADAGGDTDEVYYSSPAKKKKQKPSIKLTPEQEAAAIAGISEDKTITEEKPETKYGNSVMNALVNDHKSKNKKKVGLRTIVENLAQRMHTILIEGKSQLRKAPAHYQHTSKSGLGKWPSHIIRDREMVPDSIIHELGHALSAIVRQREPRFIKRFNKALAQLTVIPGSRASALSAEEGFAEFIRRFVKNPLSMPSSIKDPIASALDKIDPKIMGQIRDAHRAYSFHMGRGTAEIGEADLYDKGIGEPARKVLRDWLTGVMHGLVGGQVVESRLRRGAFYSVSTGSTMLDKLTRDDFIVPTGVIVGPLRYMLSQEFRDKVRLANSVVTTAVNTNRDTETAYQAMSVDVVTEKSALIHGVASGQEGVRAMNDVPDADYMPGVRPGIDGNVPDEFKVVDDSDGSRKSVGELSNAELMLLELAGLPVPKSAKQGEFLYFTEKSYATIKAQVKPGEWYAFEQYALASAELARMAAAAKSKAYFKYAGMYDGRSPAALQELVAKSEAERPDWVGTKRDLEQFFRGLLMMSVVSGEIDVPAAVRIATRFEFYLPLEKAVQGSTGSGSGRKRGNPSAGIRRQRWGSSLQNLSLDTQVDNRARRAIEAYYTSRYINTQARFIGSIANDRRVEFKGRMAISNLMLPLKMDIENTGTIDEGTERDIIADAMNRQNLSGIINDATLSKMTGQDLRDLAELNGVEVVEPGDVLVTNPTRKMWAYTKVPNAKYVVSSFVRGKRQYWHLTDRHMFDMIAGAPASAWGKQLAYVASALRPMSQAFSRMITRSPLFAIWNTLSRDIFTAMQNSAGWESFVPGAHLAIGTVYRLKNMLSGVGTTDDTAVLAESEVVARQLMAVHGDARRGWMDSIGGSFMDMLKEGIVIPGYWDMPNSQKIANIPGQAMSIAGKIVDIANWTFGGYFLSNIGESLPREGAMRMSLARGDTMERARMNRNKITGNFGQKPGNPLMSDVVGSVSFLNATIQSSYQGLDSMYHPDPAVRGINVASKALALVSMGAVAASVNYLLTLAMATDDEDLKRKLTALRERPEYDRLRNMSLLGIRAPFGNGWGAGMFAYGFNSIEGMLINKPVASADLAFETLKHTFDVPGIYDFAQPQLKALAEVIDNRSFYYDRPLTPGWLQEKFPQNPELQEYDSTPTPYKAIARALADMPLTGRKLAISPLKIQHLVRNGFSREIDLLIGAADKIADSQPLTSSDFPLVGRLFTREPRGFSSESVDTLNDLNDEFLALRNRLKDYATYDPNSPAIAEVRRRALELVPANKAMNQIEDIYDRVKIARRQKRFDDARDLERQMTLRASQYFDAMANLRKK